MVVLLSVGGCASTLTDELAVTVARTRDTNIEASKGLAKAMTTVPLTLERLNDVLATGARTAEELRLAEKSLTTGVSRVTSASSELIEQGAKLVGHLDAATVTVGKLLDDARLSAETTRQDRDRIVVGVARITSSIEALVARAEESSRVWTERTRELRDQESRAAQALTQVAEATARTAADAAVVTSALGRLAGRIEPDVSASSKSVAAILGDVAKITGKLASEETTSTGTIIASAIAGVLGAAIVVAIAAGVRVAFRRAVARAVADAIAARGDRKA